jgi:hypothetical protein
MRRSLLALLIAILPACSSGAATAPAASTELTDSTEAEVTTTTYYEMTSRLSETDLSRWYTARTGLVDGFNNICGDTFCEGDFSNLSHVALACSITQSDYVKECTWVFGGSIEYIGKLGGYTIDARTFACTVPVKAQASEFLTALEAGDPLRAPLPATGTSFYDALGGCLNGVGDPPPDTTGFYYVELFDYLNLHGGDLWAWEAARWSLVDAFDQICGDTFCEGQYPDITALRLVCATKESTGVVKNCRWSFAAVDLSVTTKGHVSAANDHIYSCPIQVSGPAADVVSALSVSDPLYAPLPGSQMTLMDQLITCF